jgi:hypothetical protein
VPSLKEHCKSFGLLVGGTKQVLIDRLTEYAETH